MRVDVIARRWRWVCESTVCGTTFALSDFTLGRLMLVIDNFFLAYTGARARGRYWRCTIERYCVRDDVIVDGHSMLLKTRKAIWSVILRHQLLVRRFIRRFRAFRTHREWPSVEKHHLICFEDWCFAYAIIITILISLLACTQTLVNVLYHKR